MRNAQRARELVIKENRKLERDGNTQVNTSDVHASRSQLPSSRRFYLRWDLGY